MPSSAYCEQNLIHTEDFARCISKRACARMAPQHVFETAHAAATRAMPRRRFPPACVCSGSRTCALSDMTERVWPPDRAPTADPNRSGRYAPVVLAPQLWGARNRECRGTTFARAVSVRCAGLTGNETPRTPAVRDRASHLLGDCSSHLSFRDVRHRPHDRQLHVEKAQFRE